MRIGNVDIDPPVALAPMSGINDRPFRLICRQAGAGVVWTGLVSANALRYGSAKSADLLRFGAEERPVCAQVFGAEPEIVARAAAEAERCGADLVDINMGCSVPKVLKGCAGAALMADPERAEAMVAACVRAVRLPVLVKLRAGWRSRGEGAVAVARRAERAGAAAVTVHPRWVEQRLRGQADWTIIAAVKRAVGIPVIGNGDVEGGDGALRMLEETGCDAVMVGRAALGNPWVFGEMAAALAGNPAPALPDPAERIATAARHASLAVADRGERVAITEMRKHISWYLRGLPMARSLRERTNRAATHQEVLSILDDARSVALVARAAGDTGGRV